MLSQKAYLSIFAFENSGIRRLDAVTFQRFVFSEGFIGWYKINKPSECSPLLLRKYTHFSNN